MTGNRDPAPLDLGGATFAERIVGPVTFRHCSDGAITGEVSGH